MRLASRLLAAVALVAAALPASAGRLADVAVYDRTAGRDLPIYQRHGRHYVAGEPGHEYELRITSRESDRLLAVTSIDGVNVLTGETASTAQRGYVVAPWSATRIEGWRKSLADVAAFYFTRLPDSYAARTGRPDDVGVIGVALFRERPPPCCWPMEEPRPVPPPYAEPQAGAEGDASGTAPAPAAPQVESQRAPRASERIGTGHGGRRDSWAREVPFERASDTPDEVLTIWYDSRRNLVAQGIIPTAPPVARHRPQPFPGGFVPDP